jgi:hypothetical protein
MDEVTNRSSNSASDPSSGLVCVRGAREHNLKDISGDSHGRAGRFHRRIRFGQIVARVRDIVR